MKIDRRLWFVHVMLIFAIMGSGGMIGYTLTLAPVDLSQIVRLWPSALAILAATAAIATAGFMLRKTENSR